MNSTAQPREAEVAIIGAGPIGIELAAGLQHAGVEALHVDAGPIGATMGWWAPFTRFFSSPERIAICGVPLASIDQEKATREQYLAYLRSVVEQFDLKIHTHTRVQRITHSGGQFFFETVSAPANTLAAKGDSDGLHQGSRRAWRARKIFVAIGNMHGPRMIDVPGEGLPHVSHYLGDPHQYFRRRVLIVGGRNSAVEAAIRLYRVGAAVAISYRKAAFDAKRVKYWLRPELEWLISKGRIQFHPETVVMRIDPHAVELANVNDCTQRHEVAADDVLLLTGYVQDASLLRDAGVELVGDERVPRHNRETMETNVPGVYIAGTAAAGSPRRTTLFIENSHVHVARIVRAIAGAELPWPSGDEYSELAES